MAVLICNYIFFHQKTHLNVCIFIFSCVGNRNSSGQPWSTNHIASLPEIMYMSMLEISLDHVDDSNS